MLTIVYIWIEVSLLIFFWASFTQTGMHRNLAVISLGHACLALGLPRCMSLSLRCMSQIKEEFIDILVCPLLAIQAPEHCMCWVIGHTVIDVCFCFVSAESKLRSERAKKTLQASQRRALQQMQRLHDKFKRQHSQRVSGIKMP